METLLLKEAVSMYCQILSKTGNLVINILSKTGESSKTYRLREQNEFQLTCAL